MLQTTVSDWASLGYILNNFTDLAVAHFVLQNAPPDILLVEIDEATLVDGVLSQTLSHLLKRLGRNIPTIFLVTQFRYSTQLVAAHAEVGRCLSWPTEMAVLINHIENLLQEGEPPARIMILDNSEQDNHYNMSLVAAGMQTYVLSDSTNIISALDEFNPDVLLIDWHTPEVSAPELAQIIRYHERWQGLTISYLTWQSSVENNPEILGSDIDEFLLKPISNLQLLLILHSRAMRARKVAALMNQDSLTGLLKHNSIKDRLTQEFYRAKRQGKPMLAVMIDIDLFKQVNDRWGHPTGDVVIQTLANLLRKRLRREDSVGRYGGEEFLVILSECSEADARQLLDAIRQSFSEITFGTGDKSFNVTFSAGIASNVQFDAETLLLAAADEALYQAKKAGRNQVFCTSQYSP